MSVANPRGMISQPCSRNPLPLTIWPKAMLPRVRSRQSKRDVAVIDVGLKVEGRVPLKEFGAKGKDGSLKVGDEVEVYVERIENALGEACSVAREGSPRRKLDQARSQVRSWRAR